MKGIVITGVIVALVLMVGGCAAPALEIQQPSSESSSISSPTSPTVSPTLVLVSAEEDLKASKKAAAETEYEAQSGNLANLESYEWAKVALRELDWLQVEEQTSDILSQEQALVDKINKHDPVIRLEIDAAGKLKSIYGNDIKSMIAKYNEMRTAIRNSMDQRAKELQLQLQKAEEEMKALTGETP